MRNRFGGIRNPRVEWTDLSFSQIQVMLPFSIFKPKLRGEGEALIVLGDHQPFSLSYLAKRDLSSKELGLAKILKGSLIRSTWFMVDMLRFLILKGSGILNVV